MGFLYLYLTVINLEKLVNCHAWDPWLCLWKTVECQQQSCDRPADRWRPVDSQGNKGTNHVELCVPSGEGRQ